MITSFAIHHYAQGSTVAFFDGKRLIEVAINRDTEALLLKFARKYRASKPTDLSKHYPANSQHTAIRYQVKL